MTFRERITYQEIHPLKLLTDWLSAFLSFYLFWQRQNRAALVVQAVPPILVSAILLSGVDLEPQRDSPFGRYVKRHMTPAMQAVRLLGNFVATFGAKRRRPELIGLGIAIVLFGWFRGKLLP